MDENHPVLVKMNDLLATWEAANDQRRVFLSCYRLMTQNILAAIDAKEFEDVVWVATLMESFAGYYFQALEADESEQTNPPTAWKIAFSASHSPHIHVLQNLMLGVNAHINRDLVFAITELLAPEWQQASPEQRQMRYRDHCHVNEVINGTINAVQDQVIDRFEPEFRVVDTLLGPLDEWMTSLLISRWREEVWEHVIHLVDPDPDTDRQTLIQRVEQGSVKRAHEILGQGGVAGLVDLI